MARRFRDEGATPIVTDLSEPDCRALADELDGDAYALDVTDSAAVTEVFAKVAANHGRLDILVNNAGISGMEDRPEEVQRGYEITMAQMTDTLAGNPPSVLPRRDPADHRRRLAPRARRPPRRHVLLHPGGDADHGAAASGVVINLGSIMGTSAAPAPPLLRGEGRDPRVDARARVGVRRAGDPGERDRAGVDRDAMTDASDR